MRRRGRRRVFTAGKWAKNVQYKLCLRNKPTVTTGAKSNLYRTPYLRGSLLMFMPVLTHPHRGTVSHHRHIHTLNLHKGRPKHRRLYFVELGKPRHVVTDNSYSTPNTHENARAGAEAKTYHHRCWMAVQVRKWLKTTAPSKTHTTSPLLAILFFFFGRSAVDRRCLYVYFTLARNDDRIPTTADGRSACEMEWVKQ